MSAQIRARRRVPYAIGTRLNPITDWLPAIYGNQHFSNVLGVAFSSDAGGNTGSKHRQVRVVESCRLFGQPPGAADLRCDNRDRRNENSDFHGPLRSSGYRPRLTRLKGFSRESPAPFAQSNRDSRRRATVEGDSLAWPGDRFERRAA